MKYTIIAICCAISFSLAWASSDKIEGRIVKNTITEWVTVSKTVPVRQNSLYLVYQQDTCNEEGRQYEVTQAVFPWNGIDKTVELERHIISSQTLTRSQPCSSSNIIDIGPLLRPL